MGRAFLFRILEIHVSLISNSSLQGGKSGWMLNLWLTVQNRMLSIYAYNV